MGLLFAGTERGAFVSFNDGNDWQALQRGLLVYPIQGCVDGVSGDHLLLAPPAVITEEQIAWAVDQLRESIKAAM